MFYPGRAATSARCCKAVGASAAVGVFVDAGQQNLIECLKGVRRYELSGCLRSLGATSPGVRCNESSGYKL